MGAQSIFMGGRKIFASFVDQYSPSVTSRFRSGISKLKYAFIKNVPPDFKRRRIVEIVCTLNVQPSLSAANHVMVDD